MAHRSHHVAAPRFRWGAIRVKTWITLMIGAVSFGLMLITVCDLRFRPIWRAGKQNRKADAKRRHPAGRMVYKPGQTCSVSLPDFDLWWNEFGDDVDQFGEIVTGTVELERRRIRGQS